MRVLRVARWVARLWITAALASAAVAVTAGPAAAGGSWLSPVRDRYEPGEVVTLVGYASSTGSQGTVQDGPFFAYLHRVEAALSALNDLPVAPFTPHPTDLPLGQLVVEPTERADYTAYRVSIQFQLPSDLPVGRYAVSYCSATCTKGLTDLIGGVIFLRMDPDHPITREWPLHEREIVNLPDTASLSGPGWQMTAADARARIPEPPFTPKPSGSTPPATAFETGRAPRRASDSDGGGATWRGALLALVATAAIGGTVFVAGSSWRAKRRGEILRKQSPKSRSASTR
jgi:hypothetical protein